MKGLKEYVKKHGKHFTKELVSAVVKGRWNACEVEKSTQRRVYYNTTSATVGDMVYLTNMVQEWPKHMCIDFCLSIVSDFGVGEGFAFKHFIDTLKQKNKEFDFSRFV